MKRILITGASRGIGRAIAIAAAPQFDELILVCRHSKDALNSLKEELESHYPVCCQTLLGDVSDPAFVAQLFQELPSIDAVVNNAGISHIGLLSDMTVEQWQTVLNTNLSSIFYTSKYAIPLMLKKKAGRIINISSVWGNVGASMEVAYSAAKGGMNSFTRALAKELAPSNIQVNAIACGVIDTDMNRCFSEEERAMIIDEIPACRMGTPEEIANMVSFLLQAPAYLTGQVITVDGGYL